MEGRCRLVGSVHGGSTLQPLPSCHHTSAPCTCTLHLPCSHILFPLLQSFFERWWRQQDEDTRALVTRLVQDGQVRAAPAKIARLQHGPLLHLSASCCPAAAAAAVALATAQLAAGMVPLQL